MENYKWKIFVECIRRLRKETLVDLNVVGLSSLLALAGVLIYSGYIFKKSIDKSLKSLKGE